MQNSSINYAKWMKLAMLTVGLGSIYKIAYVTDVLYVPFQDAFGLSNSQIAFTLTVYSVAQTIAYLLSTYAADRVPAKYLVGGSLVITGICGFVISTMPAYSTLLLVWIVLGVFCEGMYWPALAKLVRMLGRDDEQGRMFGILAGGRGIIDTSVSFLGGVILFSYFGSGISGLKATFIFYACWDITIGLITLIFLKQSTFSNKIGVDESVTFKDTLAVLKMPESWMAAFIVFFAYCGMVTTSYFNPYLVKMYHMPVAVAAIYGIIASYGLRIGAGPLSGFIVDFPFKGAASRLMYIGFAAAALVAVTLLMIPVHEAMLWPTIILTLVFCFMILSMRATYTVLFEEVKMPRKTMGASVAFACFIGFTPTMFGYPVAGWILDKYGDAVGFNMLWGITSICMFMGVIISLRMRMHVRKRLRIMRRQKALESKLGEERSMK